MGPECLLEPNPTLRLVPPVRCSNWLKPGRLLLPLAPQLALRVPYTRHRKARLSSGAVSSFVCSSQPMHSYGHAEIARLQTLRRDVDRILAQAGAKAVPAENGCVPPPSLAAGQEQSALGCPSCKDPGKRAACSIEESARPPTKRIGLGSNRPYWEDDTTAAAPCSPPRRPRSADLPLSMQAPVAVLNALQPTMAAKEPKGERCHLSSAVTTRSSAPPSIGPQLPSPTASPGSCAGHGTATIDIPDP